MDNIFDQIAHIDAVIAFHNECATTTVTCEGDLPRKPNSIEHFDNNYEKTLTFKTVDHLDIDICTILETPGQVIISATDEHGNQIAGVIVSLALLQQYINSLPQA